MLPITRTDTERNGRVLRQVGVAPGDLRGPRLVVTVRVPPPPLGLTPTPHLFGEGKAARQQGLGEGGDSGGGDSGGGASGGGGGDGGGEDDRGGGGGTGGGDGEDEEEYDETLEQWQYLLVSVQGAFDYKVYRASCLPLRPILLHDATLLSETCYRRNVFNSGVQLLVVIRCVCRKACSTGAYPRCSSSYLQPGPPTSPGEGAVTRVVGARPRRRQARPRRARRWTRLRLGPGLGSGRESASASASESRGHLV